MFALLCKPIAVPTPRGNMVLRANDCRIAYLKPSQSQGNKFEIEILEAPPVYIGADEESHEY